MKTPARLLALVEEGLVDQVLGQLMSGKEATVYVVRCGDDIRCAKVYKEASQRSFRNNASYQEGRKVRNSRQARAMEKGSRFGRKMQEEVWQSAEVDALYRIRRSGHSGGGVDVGQEDAFLLTRDLLCRSANGRHFRRRRSAANFRGCIGSVSRRRSVRLRAGRGLFSFGGGQSLIVRELNQICSRQKIQDALHSTSRDGR